MLCVLLARWWFGAERAGLVVLDSTFDHAQAGAEDGYEGDGAGRDLVGLEVEAERRLVLSWAH